jgi:hypothetical protein
MDGDHDVVAMAGQRFVDRVVHHLEHQVVQAGAVGRVADVHAGALAHGFQAFQDLDRALAIAFDAPAWLVSILGWKLELPSPAAPVFGLRRLVGRHVVLFFFFGLEPNGFTFSHSLE